MKVLSLSCVFPNPASPGQGLFIRARLSHLAALAELKIMAPITRSRSRIPYRRTDGALDVLHPRWRYPRGGGICNAAALFLQILGPARRLHPEFPFELIDSHFAFPEGIAAALLARAFRTPFVVTLRGCELLHARYRLRRVAMRWALRRAALVIAVSQQLGQLAAELGVPPARTVVIPNGVDSSIFYPRPRDAARRKYAIAGDRPAILMAGHLIQLKGHHLAIEAVHRLAAAGNPVQLLIAGGAPAGGVRDYAAHLRRLVADWGLEGTVRFVGEVSQESLAELMSAADLFCLASSREGWPNVLHEALACGCPVVATDVGGAPDIVGSDRSGFLVRPDDVDALTAGLRCALAAAWDRSAISARARERSWEQVANEVLTQLRNVVTQPQGLGLSPPV